MSQDVSTADQKSTRPRHAIHRALAGTVSAIIVALAAFTTSSQRTASSNPPPPAPAPSSTESASTSNEPKCAPGTLDFLGSSAFEQIARDAAVEYTLRCKVIDPSIMIAINVNKFHGPAVKNSDSAWGVSKACDAGEPASAIARQVIGMYDGPYNGLPSRCSRLRSHEIGALIFDVIANKQLIAKEPKIITNDSISVPSLRDIFIKHDLPGFLAVGRQAGSGTRKAFFTQVLSPASQTPDKGTCPVPTPSSLTSCTEDSTEDALKFVNETRDAIGYAETFLLDSSDYSNVSSLAIDGATPMQASVPRPYQFWAVEHLYADVVLTPLASDFLDWLPYYIHSHVPRKDFIVCADASKRLDKDCAPTPPQSPSGPALSEFDILYIGSLCTLGIWAIWLFWIFIHWMPKARSAKRLWRQLLGWALALVTVVWTTAWSVYFLGIRGVIPVLAPIVASLIGYWWVNRNRVAASARAESGIATPDPAEQLDGDRI